MVQLGELHRFGGEVPQAVQRLAHVEAAPGHLAEQALQLVGVHATPATDAAGAR